MGPYIHSCCQDREKIPHKNKPQASPQLHISQTSVCIAARASQHASQTRASVAFCSPRASNAPPPRTGSRLMGDVPLRRTQSSIASRCGARAHTHTHTLSLSLSVSPGAAAKTSARRDKAARLLYCGAAARAISPLRCNSMPLRRNSMRCEGTRARALQSPRQTI